MGQGLYHGLVNVIMSSGVMTVYIYIYIYAYVYMLPKDKHYRGSHKQGTPNYSPTFYGPSFRDSQEKAPNFGKSPCGCCQKLTLIIAHILEACSAHSTNRNGWRTS